MDADRVDSSGGWYSVSRKLLARVLNIDIDPNSQDGLGEFPDADRLTDYCMCYFGHPDLHPIVRAECVDGILGSLSLLFDRGNVAAEHLELAGRVARDAQHNSWAVKFLKASPSDFDPSTDPGDHAVAMWLRDKAGLDHDMMARHHTKHSDPSDRRQ